MKPRPNVAAPLREGLRQLATVVPTDVRSVEQIAEYRRIAATRGTTAGAIAERYSSALGEPRSDITSFTPSRAPRARALFLHGGGLIAGNRFDGVDVLVRHGAELDLEVWTVEYPLAPEAGFDEMVAVGVAAVELAARDGLPVMLAGQSAGGGLAAAVALECRDRAIPPSGLMLICPMLDDRATSSAAQYDGDPSWSPVSNASAWRQALEGANASQPGRRQDLTGLPPVYLDTGTAEVFRDSVMDFAGALWRCGVSAELHMWSGGFHGFDAVVEDAVVSQESHRARREWLRRWLEEGL